MLKCQQNEKITFSERNGLAEVEENDSNDTLVGDDEAHKLIYILEFTFSV